MTAENDWTVKLEHMPNAILSQESPEVKVVEIECGQYTLDAESVSAKTEDERTLVISFTNTYTPQET